MIDTSNTRSAVMQGALEVIAERGFHDAPMAEIAAKAGVAAGTIYRYFESKDLLIADLYRELEEKIVTIFREGCFVEQPLRERFICLSRTLFRYFIANPLHFRYLEQYCNSPYGISLREDRLLGKSGKSGAVTNIFEEGIEKQVLKDLPVPALFSLAFGPLICLIRDHVLGFIHLDDALINQVADICWDGIKR